MFSAQDSGFGIDVVALDVYGGAGSSLSLRRYGGVDITLKCVDYDFGVDECGSWVSTGIPFTDNGSPISFNVDSFSACAGAYLTVINMQSYPVVGWD